jgi:signal transduction histidine kinase
VWNNLKDGINLTQPMQLLRLVFGTRACLRSAFFAIWMVATVGTFAASAHADSASFKQENPAGALTDEEQKWLDEHHTVRVRVGEFPPYQMRKPELAGLSLDLLSSIADRYGFKVVYVPDFIGWPEAMQDVMGPRQSLDLLLTINRTPERTQQFALTQDYLAMPWVIYNRKDSPFISSVDDLAGKLVSVEKGYVIEEKLKKDHPTIRFLEVVSSEDALRALATGRADAYVGNLAVGAYLIRQFGLANLIVAAPTPYGDHKQAMAIRKDWTALASIIDKGIAGMPTETRNRLTKKWTQVEVKPQPDYTLVGQILGASALLIAAFLYWNRRLAREIACRKVTEAELARHRDHLELLVDERTTDLSRAKQKAEAANLAKSAFLANMSHEMRTPLNHLMGMSALIRRERLTPTQADRLGKLDAAVHNLTTLIDTILELTRIDAGRFDLVEEPFSLQGLLLDVLAVADEQAKKKNLQLTIESIPDIDQFVGDKQRIQQALLNYVNNAIRFAESGSVTIRAQVNDAADSSVILRFEVEDLGIGISPEDQLRLFSIFEQVDNSSTRKYGGLGVGLAMTKKIAQIMGGDAGCRSNHGVGSTFWFLVRIRKA